MSGDDMRRLVVYDLKGRLRDAERRILRAEDRAYKRGVLRGGLTWGFLGAMPGAIAIVHYLIG